MRAGWLRKEFGADTFGGSDFAQSEQQVQQEETNAGGGYPPDWLLEQMTGQQAPWKWRGAGRVMVSGCTRTQRLRVRRLASAHLNRVRFTSATSTRSRAHAASSPRVAAAGQSDAARYQQKASSGLSSCAGASLVTYGRQHVARGFARRPDNTAALLLLLD